MNPEDRSLVRRMAAGDRLAFRALYDRHVRTLYAVCLRIAGNYEDAEEAVQDTFLSLVRLGRNAESIQTPRAWLLRVASRRATDLVRQRARHQHTPFDHRSEETEGGAVVIPLDVLASDQPLASDMVAQEDLVNRLRELAQQLPDRQFLAFSLRHFQGLSIAEIAEVMECSEGTIKSHLHFALKRLRELARDRGLLDSSLPPHRRKEEP